MLAVCLDAERRGLRSSGRSRSAGSTPRPPARASPCLIPTSGMNWTRPRCRGTPPRRRSSAATRSSDACAPQDPENVTLSRGLRRSAAAPGRRGAEHRRHRRLRRGRLRAHDRRDRGLHGPGPVRQPRDAAQRRAARGGPRRAAQEGAWPPERPRRRIRLAGQGSMASKGLARTRSPRCVARTGALPCGIEAGRLRTSARAPARPRLGARKP